MPTSERTPLLSPSARRGSDDTIHPSGVYTNGFPISDSDSECDAPKTLSKAPPTPLPWLQLGLVCFIRVTEPVAFMVCFPFVNQMLLDLGVVQDSKKVGFYAGLIEAIFSVGQLLTVYFWGMLSDRIGRKPVMIIGCVGSAVSALLFGFSRSFVAMVTTRTLAGLMNGNVAVIKSTLAEITDETNSAKAFALFPLCYGVGTIIGSFIGGSLVKPAEHYPWIGKAFPFLIDYPYVLPCAVAALFPLIGALLASLFLEETLHIHQSSPPLAQPAPQAEVASSISATAGEDKGTTTLFTTQVKIMLLNFGLLTLEQTAFVGLIPLYCFTPVTDGGLGFDAARIAKALSVRATATIFVQLAVFPTLQPKVGTVRLFKLLMTLFIPTFLVLPLLNIMARLNYPKWSIWFGIWISLSCGALANMAFSCNMLMVNDAAPNRQSLGKINGVFQVVASSMRAVGPGGANALFAFSVASHALGGNLIWLCMTLCAVVGTVTALLLR